MNPNEGKRRAICRGRKVNVRWIREPIQMPKGRPLATLLYARFSREGKKKKSRSNKAQFLNLERNMEALKINDSATTYLSDSALSGELRSRPGIDEVRAGIDNCRWDLILVEESSRFYRDDVACVDLVRLAVDRGIRVIFVNDFVDTADPDWEERLKEAAEHHSRSNRFTSRRIKRAHEELFEIGAAIGLLKPGYVRIPTKPATDRDPAEGPFFDEVDPRWSPVIQEAFERIAAYEPPWSVAEWLTEKGLPKARNSESPVWFENNVVTLIRREVYRGADSYRTFYSKKEYATGKHKPRRNNEDEVLRREMPHLRIVSDETWFAANAAIDGRAAGRAAPRGFNNPQYGIPRNARGPLARVLYCRCGAKFHVGGRIGDAYCCSKKRSQGCWNKATCLREETHVAVRDAIVHELKNLGHRIDRLREVAGGLLDDGGRRDFRRAQLLDIQAKLEKSRDRLARAIELTDTPLEVLTVKLKKRDERLARVRYQLERLGRQDVSCAPPTQQEIEECIAKTIDTVSKMDRFSRDTIRTLVGRIEAVPCLQFGSNKVVLRARFRLRLAALLPGRVREAIKNLVNGPLHEQFESIPLTIDLFTRSAGPAYGQKALELKNQGLGLTAIGKALGITKRRAHLAVQFAEAMRDAGVTEPFTELTAAPLNASRWRTRKASQKSCKKIPPGSSTAPSRAK